jgi:SusD family.
MRYAEVLLMYAECCAQTGSDLPAGLAALHEVQHRAGAAHVSTECTLAEVQKEKYLECWLEGSRFPDLVRWDLASRELADNGKYLPNYCDAFFSLGEAEHRGYIDDSDALWCVTAHPDMGFKKEKHSYFPIPFAEKNVNPNVRDWYE